MDSLLALQNENFELNIRAIIATTIILVLSLFVLHKGWNFFRGKPVSSGPKLTKCPSDITVITESSVYEFYSPNGMPEFEVIFFHGLQRGDYKDAYWSTWRSRDGTVVWPKEWLSERFPAARILSISYDSCDKVTDKTGRSDMYNIGENFYQSLVLSSASNVGQNCPVVLVGHSLGGLVIKEFILTCQDKYHEFDPEEKPVNHDFDRVGKFLSNLRGVFYYGTPHGGSRLADYGTMLPSRGPLLYFLRTLDTSKSRLNEKFRKWRHRYKKSAFSVAEGNATRYGYLSAMVVEEASARQDTDRYSTVSADHIDVCKPETTKSNAFQILCEFIHTTVRESGIFKSDGVVDSQEEAKLIM